LRGSVRRHLKSVLATSGGVEEGSRYLFGWGSCADPVWALAESFRYSSQSPRSTDVFYQRVFAHLIRWDAIFQGWALEQPVDPRLLLERWEPGYGWGSRTDGKPCANNHHFVLMTYTTARKSSASAKRLEAAKRAIFRWLAIRFPRPMPASPGARLRSKALSQSTRLKSMYPRSTSVWTSCTRSLSPTSAPSKPCISLPSTGG